MPGASGSGRKGLGEVLLADALYDHLKTGADMFRDLCPGGVQPAVEAWIEACHSLVMQQEITASKTSLARALLEGDDVTDACLRLAAATTDRYGPLLRVLGAA